MDFLWCKANVKRIGFNNLHQDFDIMRIVQIMMDGANKTYEWVNNSHDIKVLMKVIETETFYVGFTSQ